MDGPALSCPRCGGSFELVTLKPDVVCPYCGHPHALEPELVERMGAYRRTVETKVAEMARHGRHVAAADRFVQTYASRGGFAGTYLVVAGLPLLLTGGAVALQSSLPGASSWLPTVLVVIVAGVALLVARFAFGARASDTARVEVGEVDVCCPECGAAAVLGAGDAVGTCRHCDAQLLATAVAVGRGVDAARRAEREAALQRFRKEREVMLRVNRPPAVMGVIVPLLVVAALGGIVHAAFREGSTEGLAALGIAAVVTAIVGVVVVRSRLLERRRRHAFRDLAHQLRGRVGHGVAELVDWLSRHWPASYPAQHLYTEGHLVKASTGYPTILCATPKRAEALLAADMAATARNADAKRHEAWLEDAGFVVRVTDAGLWLEATPELRKRFDGDAATYRLFAPALAHGARMLGAMGAEHA